jgi:hypothetical protein
MEAQIVIHLSGGVAEAVHRGDALAVALLQSLRSALPA